MDSAALKQLAATRSRLEQKYELLQPVGKGSYAVVHKARSLEDGHLVAVKVFEDTHKRRGNLASAIREIKLLRELREDKPIVRLEEVFMDVEKHCTYLVYEYGEHDLHSITIEQLGKFKKRFAVQHIKYLMQQILLGLAYLHNNWVIHRDVKPSNILVMGVNAGSRAGEVKLADFGLARIFQDPLRPLSHDGEVVTYMYRAPELLLQSQHYTRAVDMWAVGCIFAELLNLSPLFPGKELPAEGKEPVLQTEQIQTIFELLGAPTETEWPELRHMPAYADVKPLIDAAPKASKLSSQVIAHNDSDAWELLTRLLKYDPGMSGFYMPLNNAAKRITADEAAKHAWFMKQPLPEKLPVELYSLRSKTKVKIHDEPSRKRLRAK